MEFFPIFINVKNEVCLVVGGGETALSKVNLLLKAGAAVTVVAPKLCPHLEGLRLERKITHIAKSTPQAELNCCKLVIVATSDERLREEVSCRAKSGNIPVNVVDCPKLCSFTMPSIIDRSPLVIAVSTGGASPTLARMIRSRLEAMLPQSYGRLAVLIKGFRHRAEATGRNRDERRTFWNKIFSSPIVETFLSGREREAELELRKEFNAKEEENQTVGEVCLVGAGPGDPDLLTLRALRLIQNADTIVYDRLVFPTILDYARRDAELIYVGKKSANHAVPQDQINQKLVDLAKQGKMVVRLKGGDPFIFGRGGEEIEQLMDEGIRFQVVPGVTAASGCSTYAGIPLTHREYSQSCVFVTGHLKEGGMDLNWDSLALSNQTVVFYMGVANIKTVSHQLIGHGMPSSTPAAIVQKGTTKNQKVYTGTIHQLPEIVMKEGVKPPSLIIVGNVVKLHQKLAGSNLTRMF